MTLIATVEDVLRVAGNDGYLYREFGCDTDTADFARRRLRDAGFLTPFWKISRKGHDYIARAQLGWPAQGDV